MAAAEPILLSVQDYLRLELVAEERHELVGGVMYVMSGASARHNLLASALLAELRAAGLAEGCRAYSAAMKVRVGDTVYYPDVMVACAELADPYYEDAPCLIVEVISPTTGRIDRIEKLAAYRQIPSLRAYVIVETASVSATVHSRTDDGWAVERHGAGGQITLECPRVTLDVDALYHGLPPTP